MLCIVAPDCTRCWHHHPVSNPAGCATRAWHWGRARACKCKDPHPWAAAWAPKIPPQRGRLQRSWVWVSLPAARRCAGRSDSARIPPAAVCDPRTMLHSSVGQLQLRFTPPWAEEKCFSPSWMEACTFPSVMDIRMLLMLLLQDPRVQCLRGAGNLLFPAGACSALMGSHMGISPPVTLGYKWDMQGLDCKAALLLPWS